MKKTVIISGHLLTSEIFSYQTTAINRHKASPCLSQNFKKRLSSGSNIISYTCVSFYCPNMEDSLCYLVQAYNYTYVSKSYGSYQRTPQEVTFFGTVEVLLRVSEPVVIPTTMQHIHHVSGGRVQPPKQLCAA
jgi:hypothetical protein